MLTNGVQGTQVTDIKLNDNERSLSLPWVFLLRLFVSRYLMSSQGVQRFKGQLVSSYCSDIDILRIVDLITRSTHSTWTSLSHSLIPHCIIPALNVVSPI